MAIQERHNYNKLTWHFRKNSGLRDIASNTGKGFVRGVTWSSGKNIHIPSFVGIVGLGLSFVAGTLALDGPTYPLSDSKYQDDSLSYYSIENDGISYSGLITTISNETPLVLVQEDDHFRLYETETRDTGGLEWDFVSDQTDALNQIGKMITCLERTQTELNDGNSSSLPQFVDFDHITGLYNDRGDISRYSNTPEGLSVPIDLSNHLDGELIFWQNAYGATESGQYGFDTSNSYLTLDKRDGAISTSIASSAESLTLRPELNDEPDYSFGATFGASMSYIFGGLAAVSLAMGMHGGALAGASTAVNQYRRRKERPTPS